ncbi:MAG: amidohydrolase family protein [Verrucomicrobiae bacterium]|nr:amidohydrolase family protein [Verrucomicrobiae bacterium]
MFINHWHVAPEGTYDRAKPEMGSLAGMKKIMDQCGVEKGIAFAPFMHCMDYDYSWYRCPLKSERECNEWLYQSLKAYPGIYGFVTVNPLNPEVLDILTQYIHLGFAGVKMHPPIFRIKIDDPKLDDFYSTVAKLKVPILFHTGAHGGVLETYLPILLDNVANRHPELKIIIEHCGLPCFFDQALGVLMSHSKARKRFNVFAGITGAVKAKYRDKVLQLVEEVGPDRMIFGLDYPFHGVEDLTSQIDFMKNEIKLNPGEMDLVFGKNLEKILNLEIQTKSGAL